MSPAARLGAAVATLAVFVWTLTPRAISVDEPGASAETLLAASRAAFDRQQWNEALDPTRALVERFPTQHVYAKRLAQIYRELARYADEAEAWERVLAAAPTAEDACPAIGVAYEKAGRIDKAQAAVERAIALEPGRADAEPLRARLALLRQRVP